MDRIAIGWRKQQTSSVGSRRRGWARLLRAIPRRTFGVLAGTNTRLEWLDAVADWRSRTPADSLAEIEAYEREGAKVCGVEHGVSFATGTMAFQAILRAMRIGAGDEVILAPLTSVSIARAIVHTGARPVYVDIEPRTFNIDCCRIEAAITPRTKALYAQHTFGVCCDLNAIRQIGSRHGLPIIEDCAHSIGATYEGRPSGSWSETAFFSSSSAKVINTQAGGMAVTNQGELARRLREVQISTPFLDREDMDDIRAEFIAGYLLYGPWLLRRVGPAVKPLFKSILRGRSSRIGRINPVNQLGRNPEIYRLSRFQAALGRSQLKDLDRNLAHRREIAGLLEERIGWYGLNRKQMDASTWLRYSFLVTDPAKVSAMFGHRYDASIWWPKVLAGSDEDLASLGYVQGSCPIAEWVAKHIYNFPTHFRVPVKIIRGIVDRRRHQLKEQIITNIPHV